MSNLASTNDYWRIYAQNLNLQSGLQIMMVLITGPENDFK